ncbi:MAG: molecular chaperone HtpG, partial [Thiohalomonadales bacterium]
MSVEAPAESTTKETMGFQTEVKHLLHLMVHSLYSNKEIFLRELISNASDAADKLRFDAIKDKKLYGDDSELEIHVEFDKEARTVTVRDNGIGMSREDVISHIGTIAKSGTKQFIESLTGDQAKDANLIGQFGVGFYSTFIIADKVTLNTRRAGSASNEGVEWTSEGEGEFTLQAIDKEQRGTEVILHLKKDEDEFLDGYRLRNIISKYSDHIPLPIIMEKQSTPSMDDKDDKDDENKDKDKEKEDKIEYETVNQASALWTRAKKDISDAEYNEFYKHVAHDFEDPLERTHNRVEGTSEYTTLLYIPQRAPFDLWDRERRSGIKLYVKRVFIMDDAENLMPNYLRFVKGIIDSNDLPLNVSREILQKNKVIDTIKTSSVKKILSLLENMAEKDKDKYNKFWAEFGKVLKEGPGEDYTNKERVAGLLRFSSTLNDAEEQEVSLKDYISRMKDDQKAIYFVTADSFAAAKNSPHLEIFRKKEIEVLLLADRVDEWLVSSLMEFDGKKIENVTKGTLDLGDLTDKEEKEAQEKIGKEFESVITQL